MTMQWYWIREATDNALLRGAQFSSGPPSEKHFIKFTVKSAANQRESITQMNKLEIKGDWNITKGKLKQKWAKLTDDDLQWAEGKQEELVGRIQKRTGESREAIEKAIKETSSCGCK